MNKQLIAIIVFGMLLLFIISPFSALAGLMVILLSAAIYNLVINLFKALIGESKADAK
ncbi:MAG: hypothetical protein HC836_31415 [Richelia sp. RM2_1_2]|nr:hypothetical protein [Richelia sp. SM1_7_0]NJN09131.1 hypothetical protein [Richelia sp. RM1_1_1]NJO30300.1 hypothetical protein [Richelia sp. SL_2_1]NJO62577.1 hypothetical protein [Richelia sp. RM2_1_2]